MLHQPVYKNRATPRRCSIYTIHKEYTIQHTKLHTYKNRLRSEEPFYITVQSESKCVGQEVAHQLCCKAVRRRLARSGKRRKQVQES